MDKLTGNISTVASNGTSGFSGDGGSDTSAQSDFVSRIAVDPSGNIFFSEQSNSRIRKVTAVADPSRYLLPGVSTWGLIVLVALITGAALVMLRRRTASEALAAG